MLTVFLYALYYVLTTLNHTEILIILVQLANLQIFFSSNLTNLLAAVPSIVTSNI
jgi:hypothetical protein